MYHQSEQQRPYRAINTKRLSVSATCLALILVPIAGRAMNQNDSGSVSLQTQPVQITPSKKDASVAEVQGPQSTQQEEIAKPDLPEKVTLPSTQLPAQGTPGKLAVLGSPDAAGAFTHSESIAATVAELQKQIFAQQMQLQALQKQLGVQPETTPLVATPSHDIPASGGEPSVPAEEPLSTPTVVAKPEEQTSPPEIPEAKTVPSGPVEPASTVAASSAALAPVENPPLVSPPASTDLNSNKDIPLALTTDTQRQAYASGASVWREIQRSIESQRALGIYLDEHYVLAGFQDMASHHSLKMSKDEMNKAIADLNREYTSRAREAREYQEAQGKSYRIGFSKQKGALSDAGAWYRIEERGKGRRLRTTDIAVLQVTGSLPDGTVFDSSGQRGETRTVKVGELLPSVVIGLQKVSPGGRIKVVVPPGKGYGDAGLPPLIPGGATLIFDIIVKDVKGDA